MDGSPALHCSEKHANRARAQRAVLCRWHTQCLVVTCTGSCNETRISRIMRSRPWLVRLSNKTDARTYEQLLIVDRTSVDETAPPPDVRHGFALLFAMRNHPLAAKPRETFLRGRPRGKATASHP